MTLQLIYFYFWSKHEFRHIMTRYDCLAIFEPTLIPFFVNVLCPESLLLGVLLDGPEDGPAD